MRSISGRSATTCHPDERRNLQFNSNIRNYPQFVEKLRYIHRNPVKRGYCQRPEDWPWGSFRHYATGTEGRVEIESEWTARRRERAAGALCPSVELSHASERRA
jgi:putative transposase